MEARVMAIGRMHQHRAMTGGPPVTIPGGHLRPTGATYGDHFPYRYPYRRNLSPLQADLLELIRVAPRNQREAAEALGIGEWSKAAHALGQLVKRGLAEEIRGYPTRWAAI